MARAVIHEKLESLRRCVERVRSRSPAQICTRRLEDFRRFAEAVETSRTE